MGRAPASADGCDAATGIDASGPSYAAAVKAFVPGSLGGGDGAPAASTMAARVALSSRAPKFVPRGVSGNGWGGTAAATNMVAMPQQPSYYVYGGGGVAAPQDFSSGVCMQPVAAPVPPPAAPMGGGDVGGSLAAGALGGDGVGAVKPFPHAWNPHAEEFRVPDGAKATEAVPPPPSEAAVGGSPGGGVDASPAGDVSGDSSSFGFAAPAAAPAASASKSHSWNVAAKEFTPSSFASAAPAARNGQAGANGMSTLLNLGAFSDDEDDVGQPGTWAQAPIRDIGAAGGTQGGNGSGGWPALPLSRTAPREFWAASARIQQQGAPVEAREFGQARGRGGAAEDDDHELQAGYPTTPEKEWEADEEDKEYEEDLLEEGEEGEAIVKRAPPASVSTDRRSGDDEEEEEDDVMGATSPQTEADFPSLNAASPAPKRTTLPRKVAVRRVSEADRKADGAEDRGDASTATTEPGVSLAESLEVGSHEPELARDDSDEASPREGEARGEEGSVGADSPICSTALSPSGELSASQCASGASARLSGPPRRVAKEASSAARPCSDAESRFAFEELLRWRVAAIEEGLRDEAVVYSFTERRANAGTSEGAEPAAPTRGSLPSQKARADKTASEWPAERGGGRGGDRGSELANARGQRPRLPGGRGEGASKAPILDVSPTSWVAQQQILRQARRNRSGNADGKTDAEVEREMKSILNKLTLERFDQLYSQLVGCGICSEEHVKILMREVFEKATMQHRFIGMYAELCVQLQQWFVGTEAWQEDTKIFKRILLNQCQLSFEQNLRPREDLSELEPAKRLEAEHIHKTRMLGNLRFVGSLLEKGMLASKILIYVVEALLEDPNVVSLECLTVFLTAVGPSFDRPDYKQHVQLRDAFQRVRTLSQDSAQPPRVRCLLQDVLDLRASGWQNRKKAVRMDNGPMTLEEVQRQVEEETGERVTVPRPSASASRPSAPVQRRSGWQQEDGRTACSPTDTANDRRHLGGSSAAAPSSPKRTPPTTPTMASAASARPKAKQLAFDTQRFHEELSAVLKELRASADVQSALDRLRNCQPPVPPDQQACELVELLVRTCEESNKATRANCFDLLARLVLDGVWQPACLAEGLQYFAEYFEELKIDLPALPAITRDELAPGLAGLVQAGHLRKEVQEDLIDLASA